MTVAVLFRQSADGIGRFDDRAVLCGVFTRDAYVRYVDDHPLPPNEVYHAWYTDLDVGLPGTAGAEPAENAPDCEDDAAPVASICYDGDDEC
jgi:hypothetical protein